MEFDPEEFVVESNALVGEHVEGHMLRDGHVEQLLPVVTLEWELLNQSLECQNKGYLGSAQPRNS